MPFDRLSAEALAKLQTDPPCAHVVSVAMVVEPDPEDGGYLGVRAEAEVAMNLGTAGSPYMLTTPVRSPGVWRVDEDIGHGTYPDGDARSAATLYTYDLYLEECRTLGLMLATLGLELP
jgi:hypothetical protein